MRGRDAEQVGDDVKRREGPDAHHGSIAQPGELAAHDGIVGMAHLRGEHGGSGEVHRAQECQPDAVEQPARFEDGRGRGHPAVDKAEVQGQQHGARHIHQRGGHAAANPFLGLWEHTTKMEKKCRREEPGHHVTEVHDLIEIIQLAGVVERIQDEAD